MGIAPVIQDPDADLDYQLDWAAPDKPWLPDGDSIVTSTWEVSVASPSGAALPTVHTTSNTATTATAFVTGGDAGADYWLTNRIVTAGGLTDLRSIPLFVRKT